MTVAGGPKTNCNDKFWKDAGAFNGTRFTSEHEQFYKAWKFSHRDSYPDEDALKDFSGPNCSSKDRAHIEAKSHGRFGEPSPSMLNSPRS